MNHFFNIVLNAALLLASLHTTEEPAPQKPLRETEAVDKIATAWGYDIERDVEVVLPDGSRADLVTETHVYEADWGSKWAEGVGQSLHYAHVTGKKPGILLLMRGTRSDKYYFLRVNNLCKKYDIKLVIIKVDGREVTAPERPKP